MAIPFLNNITLNNNEIQNVRLQNAGNPPLNSGPGQIYFDSTANPGAVPPTYDLTVKYYSNVTDTWVSLKEYSFPTSTYVTGAVTGTTPKPIITFDLNAVDGAAAAGERYLTKTNLWAAIADIPGTYKWVASDNAATPVSADINSSDTFQLAATADLTSNLTGGATTTKILNIGLKVDGGAGIESNYIVNQGSATAAADDTIPFSDYTDNVDPVLDTYVVKKTTFGTIPVNALTLVKQYIDDSVVGGLIYQGGYDAANNAPDLTITPNSILKGWTYTVTVEGTFYGEQLRVGDVLISEVNNPAALADWTTVQNNIDIATDGTDTGGGAAVIGISRYDENDFTVSPTGFVQLNATSFSGLIGNGLATSINLQNTGAIAPNINHGLGDDSSSFMIQLVEVSSGGVSSGATVYADVTRGAGGLVTIDFAVAPATNSIRVLIQKIG